MLPKAILFDLDDTIISFDGVCEPAWKKVCGDFAPRMGMTDADMLLNAIRETRRWYWGDPERHRIGRLDLDNARREVVCLAFKALGCPNDHCAVELADGYIKLQEEMIHLFPGAVETLEELAGKGVKLALLTNGNRVKQRAKIDRFNLERFFEICLVEGELGFGKPDARVYTTALGKLKIDASQTWMVGDNLEWDVAAPQKLGIFGIWNDYTKRGMPQHSGVVPDRIISSICELLVE